MAEKRVSVRLSAIGGNSVKAEFRGIGEAGARGMARIRKEMALVNARLAKLGRALGRVLRLAGLAVAGAISLAVRSSLNLIDSQAKLAQSLGTTTASIQVLQRAGDLAGVSLGEIQQASLQLTKRLSQAAAGTGPAVKALDQLGLSAATLSEMPLDARIATIQDAIEKFVSPTERAAVASQLFGDRAGLIFSRIDSATLRQATKDVRDFGVVVSETDADQIEATNDALSRLGLIGRGVANRLAVALAPALQAAADGIAAISREGGPVAVALSLVGQAVSLLIDNFGRIASIAAGFAVFLAGRFVGGLALAALGVRGLATALVILRGALIRTGIGAIIVGLGELIFQFSRLVASTGSFGAAMALLRDVAVEVWDRIALKATIAWARIEAGWAGVQAAIFNGLQDATNAVTGWANSTIGAFRGAFDAVGVIWGTLPGVIGEVAIDAANAMLGGIESMLNGAIRRIDAFTGKIRDALAAVGIDTAFGQIGNIDLGTIDNPFEGSAAATGEAIARAFRDAMDRTFVDAPDLFGGMAEAARGRAEGQAEAARILERGLARPMTALKALFDALRSGAGDNEDATGALSAARNAAKELETELANAGKAAGKAGAAAKTTGKAAKDASDESSTGFARVAQGLGDFATQARDLGGGIGDVLVGAFRSADGAFRSFVDGGKVNFKGLIASMIADLATLSFRSSVLGPLASSLSGALSGVFGALAGPGQTFAPPGGGLTVNTPNLLPKFAAGTKFAPGGLALVGENGTEIVDLPRGARVTPAARTRAIFDAAGQRAAPSGDGRLDVRVFVDRDGNWQAAVERISGRVTARMLSAASTVERRAFGDRVQEFNARGTT